MTIIGHIMKILLINYHTENGSIRIRRIILLTVKINDCCRYFYVTDTIRIHVVSDRMYNKTSYVIYSSVSNYLSIFI